MTIYEYLMILFSAVAIISSLIAIYRAEEASKKSNETAMGQTQVEIRSLIESTRKDLAEANVKYIRHARPDEFNEALRMAQKAAIERHLNAYDEACAKYLENKVDRESFKRLYRTEIKNLVESSVTSEYIMKNETDYQDIRKVYAEWEGKI